MATKKKVVETTEDAFRSALFRLVGLDFQVILEGNVALVRHPQAKQYTKVGRTRVQFRDFQDRVEVDSKRVAKSEILDRTVAASLADIEAAQRQVEFNLRQAARREEQYTALVESGVAQAAKGMTWNRGKYGSGEGLIAQSEGFKALLTKDSDGTINLAIEVQNGKLPAIAAALKAARKAGGA
jgi:hypothetical protein